MATKKNQKRSKSGGVKKLLKKSAGPLLKKSPLKKSLKTKQKTRITAPAIKSPAFLKKNAPAAKKAAAPKKSIYSKALRVGILSSADVRQRLIDMGGENTIDIIREFDADMTDEELARKISMKASDVRVVLNRLHNLGLFFYTRMRDKDSGWYSYIWKMNEGKLKEFSDSVENSEQGETARVIEGESYHCLNCGPGKLVDFETAMDAQFRCGKCGSALEFFEAKRK